ncbi:hypothetical protein SERLADRAFT_480126 [Serpula lacrymans var. lacrymans S7.9]|uniref:Uncharacterized protein n=1 Tax=Serpula lacrymans var. lacrymans (strain S7.9) TaxID=578457 RepID=F8PCN9_SERL9|nr:uncharacterized protein SERLADRAFT_480126 [Serpula lacrymans var. lacrymans S7.9]EGO18988.1 hypothetical protein SERLADRAFT_480126 [Serpula lacrymans var. lacrymans S7.9]
MSTTGNENKKRRLSFHVEDVHITVTEELTDSGKNVVKNDASVQTDSYLMEDTADHKLNNLSNEELKIKLEEMQKQLHVMYLERDKYQNYAIAESRRVGLMQFEVSKMGMEPPSCELYSQVPVDAPSPASLISDD